MTGQERDDTEKIVQGLDERTKSLLIDLNSLPPKTRSAIMEIINLRANPGANEAFLSKEAKKLYCEYKQILHQIQQGRKEPRGGTITILR